MLDWISSFATEVDTTLKTVFTVVATIVFIMMSAKGSWTAARVIISAIVAAGLIAIVWNLKIFANRVETDFKAAPAIVVTYVPQSSERVAA